MKNRLVYIFSLLTLALPLYGAPKKNSIIIKETFKNNYGIIVTGSEWAKRGKSGTITRVLKDGSTTHEVYVNGLLNGEITHTFPHTETISSVRIFDQGKLLSLKSFFVNGLPSIEEVYHSDGSRTVSKWPENKDLDVISEPYFIETTQQGRVLQGFYSSINGRYVSKIQNGEGIRSIFSSTSNLLSEETFSEGVMIKRTTFYPNRDPETITHYLNYEPHGIKCSYLQGGIPNTIEEWRHGYQDGNTTIFKNGYKVSEISFVKGKKEGLELRYNEQELIAEEVYWKSNMLHGMRKIYAGGVLKQEWYHHGKVVSKSKFDRLNSVG